MGVSEFFQSLWFSFLNDLSLADKFLALLPYLGTVLFPVLWVRNRYLGRGRDLAQELSKEKDALAKEKVASKGWLDEYNRAEARLKKVEAELPEKWLDDVDRERKEGNEERALGRLRDRMNLAALPLSQAADELAAYHLSVAEDANDGHLTEAQRYNRLAVLHGGPTPERSGLALELDELGVEQGSSTVFHTWDDLQQAFPKGDDGLAAIAALNKRTVQYIDAGQYYLAKRTNRRAALIGERSGQKFEPSVLTTRLQKIWVLNLIGDHKGALAEIEVLAPMQNMALPAEHPDVLSMRYWKAMVLDGLGDHKGALAVVDALGPLHDKALPAEHLDVIATRYLKAMVLGHLGDYKGALAEINAIAPLQEKILSAEHPDALLTRYMKVQFLADLGDYKRALAEIEALAPMQEKALPAEHPDNLETQSLYAEVLGHAGRLDDALSKIDSAMGGLRKVVPERHRFVLRARRRRVAILIGLQRQVEARAELIPLLSDMAEFWPNGHDEMSKAKALLDTFDAVQTKTAGF